MLKIDKATFFNQRKLPPKNFYYSYNDHCYEISLDSIVNSINGFTEEKCLFLLDELKATDDFIINIYMKDLADEYIQRYLRKSLFKELESAFLEKREIKFKITNSENEVQEYIAYQGDQERYHIDEIEKLGDFAGWARYNDFRNHLRDLIKSHVFDCKSIKKP